MRLDCINNELSGSATEQLGQRIIGKLSLLFRAIMLFLLITHLPHVGILSWRTDSNRIRHFFFTSQPLILYDHKSMEALIVLTIIVTIILLVVSVVKINDFCDSKYDYEPFSIGNLFLMSLSQVVIFLAAMVYFDEPEGWSLNVTVIVSIAVVIMLYTTIKMIAKTNVIIGIYSGIVQAVTGMITFLLVLLLLGAFRGK